MKQLILYHLHVSAWGPGARKLGARNFRAGLEKLHLAQKPEIIFQSPELLENKTNFLIFKGIFMNFDKYMGKKSAHFIRNSVYDTKYQNLRPIFATARKNIFGKLVTLYLRI